MPRALLTNNAITTLLAGINNSVTSLTVASGTGALFPTPGADYFYCTLTEGALIEIVKVTARSSDAFTIMRAQDGTTAQAFTIAARVSLNVTAAVLAELASLTGTETLANKTLTSPTLTTPALGTPASGNLSGCTVDGTNKVGFLGIPPNSQSAAYTTVLSDAGKSIYHPSADTTARTWTIASNANVPYPIGTAITFDNDNGAGVITIAIASDTMRLAGVGTTGSRTLAANGIATAIKNGTTSWKITGTGLT